MNEDGSLVVLGRKRDFSVIDGSKFFNFDVERAVLKHDKIKLCEIQTHPDDDSRLVAHIVWENGINDILKTHPDKQEEYLREIQHIVFKNLNMPMAVPQSFRIWDSFPSAYSGKRDINCIKNTVDKLILIEFVKSKNI